MATGPSKEHSLLFQKAHQMLTWLWKPLWGFWSVVLGGGVINVAASWLITQARSFTLDGTPLGWLLIHPGITFPFIACLIMLTVLSYLSHRQTARQISPPFQQRRRWLRLRDQHSVRQDLLDQMRATWITNVLEQSLHHTAWIDLRLQDQPNALENPWRFVAQELDQPARALPAGINIAQLYDDAKGELLTLYRMLCNHR